jgi:hypothetical protein
MAKAAASNQPTKPAAESIAAGLTFPERILLFCRTRPVKAALRI